MAKDFLVQALEQIKTGAANEAEDGLPLLKHANEQCASLGDAWYYRSVFERRLNQGAKANYSLSKAKMFGSEAMEQGLDPFVLATGASAGTVTLGPVREKWALVVGISKFSDQRVPHLNYPAKDAQDFANLLKSPEVGRFKPDNVRVLLDEQATTREIKTGLNWLARNAKPGDLVVVFLSSHGSPREMDTRNVNYIVTTDTEIRPQDQLFATALAMVELTQVVRSRILAQRTVILLDTCHSGAAAVSSIPESSIATDTLDQIRQGYGRAIVTSSRVGESSYEDDDDRNGYFTFFLMQSLQQSHGLAPISKIYDDVRLKVSRTVQTKYKVSQTPVLSTSDRSGEIVIGVAPTG